VDGRAGADVIGQLHDAIKVSGSLVAAHLQDIDQPVMQPGDGLELENPVEFALNRQPVLEVPLLDDLDGAVGAEGVPGEPDLSAAAAADEPDQLVVRDDWNCICVRHVFVGGFTIVLPAGGVPS